MNQRITPGFQLCSSLLLQSFEFLYENVPASRGMLILENGAMISIIDDDSIVRKLIGDLINSIGYRALTFASAEQFLDSGQAAKTACLITDLQMPGLSGLDLQERLLKSGYRTPVIFVTAYPKDKARERALSAGAVAFLTKPFNGASLVRAVESALAAC